MASIVKKPQQSQGVDSELKPGILLNWNEINRSEHIVQFYETDEFLLDSLSSFVISGLQTGDACIVIATPAHRKGLAERLGANGLDLDAFRSREKYISLDADETLARFMHDDMLDPVQFVGVIGDLIARAAKEGRFVRIFGEMVALLWRSGKRTAAIRLEELWNDLHGKVPSFSLFCAYATHDFADAMYGPQLAVICDLHSQVIPGESYTALISQDERLRTIVQLQQKATSLQAEIAQRQALEEEYLYLAAIVSSSDDAILGKNLNGIITSWNAAAERLYGYSAQEIVGQSVSLLYPPERKEEMTQIMERIRRGEGVDHYETTRLHKNGNLLHVSVTISPIKKKDGTVIGASTIARDISKRKELERQKEVLISMVTHELKTPLTALQGNIQLAHRSLHRLASQLDSEQAEQQQLLESALTLLSRGQRLLRVQNRLIDDLLDASRMQQNTLELQFACYDLVDVVREVVQDYQASYPRRDIALELSPEQEALPARIDRDRIGQVLGNYLTNAIKYSPADQPVHVGLVTESSVIRVWVRDHGPGLPTGEQQRIWEQFYRAPDIQAQNGSGASLGLGLYICQKLIHSHQGQVGMESAPGQGATFWFTLPRLSQEACKGERAEE